MIRCACACAAIAAVCSSTHAQDWPRWGGRNQVNMVSDAKGIPASFEPGEKIAKGKPSFGDFDVSRARNVKWIAKLGSQTYGNPTVADGRVFVGTNNDCRRDQKHRGDRGVFMCFEEESGKFLWQLVIPRLFSTRCFNPQCGHLGVCSSPTVDGDRVYVVSNRAEVICLDVKGLADGNDGPFLDEGVHMTRPSKQELNPAIRVVKNKAFVDPGVKPIVIVTPPKNPMKPGPTDADIIWRFDMMNEIPIWMQDAASCSPLVYGDVVFVATCNGVDDSHRNLPCPNAPCLIALDKKTGKLLATDDAGIGPRTLHCSWSSPSIAKVKGRDLLLYGGPDGVCYAFDPKIVPGKDGEIGKIRKVWQYDCSPPEARFTDPFKAGYRSRKGPSEIIGTPVCVDGRVYVTVGQDPGHGHAKTVLSCIDPTDTGDITDKNTIWRYTDIDRSLSTPTVADGLVYVGDLAGTVHCVDAVTGKRYWKHETGSEIWSSALVVDGKVFIGDKAGNFWTFAHGKEKKLLNRVNLHVPVHCSAIVANGVLYVTSNWHLFAVQSPPNRN